MTRLVLRLLLPVVTLFALSIGAVRVGYALAVPFPDVGVFSFSDCELPCWMGLEVGVTPRANVDAVLEQFEVTLEGETQRNFTVHNNLRGILNRSVQLDSLTLIYAGCPLMVFRELGTPDLVERDAGGFNPLFFYNEGVTVQVDVMFDYGDASIYFTDAASAAAYIASETSNNIRLDFMDSQVQGLVTHCEW